MYEKWIERGALLFYLVIMLLSTAVSVVILRVLHIKDPASWVQAVGSIGAILSAVWILNRQNKDNAQRARMEMRAIIQSLGDEVSGLYDLFAEFSGPKLMSAPTGAFLFQIPMTDNAFKIYNSVAGRIGGIEDAALRKQIVLTYTRAYGFVQSVVHNNGKLDQYWAAKFDFDLKNPEQKERFERAYLGPLEDYGPKIRESYRETQNDAVKLMAMIDATLGKPAP